MPSNFCVHRTWHVINKLAQRIVKTKPTSSCLSRSTEEAKQRLPSHLGLTLNFFYCLFSTLAIHVFLELFWGSLNNNITVANRVKSWVIKWNTNRFSSIVQRFFCLQFKCLRSVLHQRYFAWLRAVGSSVRAFKGIKMLQGSQQIFRRML